MNGTARADSPVAPDHEILAPEPDLVTQGQDMIEFDQAFMKRLTQNVEAYKQIITTSIKLTTAWDWQDLGGKPYMQSSGAEKVASPFHVSHDAPLRERLEREDAKGRYYIYTHTARFHSRLLNRSIVVTGTCSSRDQFFSTKNGEAIPQEDVDESNVLKASLTNMLVNGITRLLGIRNLTWEQLSAGGIARDSVGKVAFRKGGQGGGQSEAASKPGMITSGQVKLVFARIAANKITLDDLYAHLELLKLAKDVNVIPIARLDEILAWIGQAEQRRAIANAS